MEFWHKFVLLFCGVVSAFIALLGWCCCVLAKRADEAWLEAIKGRQYANHN